MNKSSKYQRLSITVTAITQRSVTYTLSRSRSGDEYTWGATTAEDRAVASMLRPGQSYIVTTITDKRGTQHWVSATPVVIQVVRNDPPPRSRQQQFLDEIFGPTTPQ